jgi:hypothetical protein
MKEGPFNGRMQKKKTPWIAFRTWETWLEHAKAEKVKNENGAPVELNLRTESSL